jgi:hypothetical protein
MKHRSAIVVVFVVIALLLTSCAAQREAAETSDAARVVRETVVVEREVEKAAAPAMEAPGGMGSAMSTYGDVADRMIIRTTYMTVVVEDTDAMLALVQRIVAQYGGYVSDLNRWLSNEQPYATVTLRIPAEHLEEALGQVREGSILVESERSSGQDVTEEYVDLSARLRNLEATEAELLELLSEVRRNRGSAEDILAIHNRITQIRGEIESLKGRTQYLERMTDLATVTIEIRPRQQPGAVVEPEGWNPLVTVSEAARALVDVLEFFAKLAIWLAVLSPLVLVPALVLWLLIRALRKRRRS